MIFSYAWQDNGLYLYLKSSPSHDNLSSNGANFQDFSA